MLDGIIHHLLTLSPGWFYLALFAGAYLENIFPPVPGDTVTVFGAYMAGRSERSLAAVFVSTNLGSIAGFMTYYFVGRLIHPEFFARRNYRFLPASNIEKAGRWFRRWGYWIVLLNRFLTGVRSVISIVCGMYRLPWLRVLIVSSIGCSIWNTLLIRAGYSLGTNWRLIDQILRHYSRTLLVAGLLLIVVWLVRRKVSNSSMSQ
jgi:membrane protein DedA with SNARE-associated domain